MSALRFAESRMVFSWDEADCLRIEKSETYTHLGSGVKICEFVANDSGVILFVEAKSSFSSPANPGDFAANIEEICDKFRDSLLLFAGMLLGRAPIRRVFAVDSVLAINERIALDRGLVKELEA